MVSMIAVEPVSAEELFTADVYLMGSEKKLLLFRKYNSYRASDGREVLAHVYTYPDGRPVATEEIVLINGKFREYTLDFERIGCGCGLTREGERVFFTFKESASSSSGSGRYTDNLVMGPTLAGFVRRHWETLRSGGKVPFRIPIPNRRMIADFTLRRIDNSTYQREGARVFEMKIASLFIGLFLAPNYLVFDAERKRLLEIHGPTVLLREVDGKLVNTDADIYYRYDRGPR